MRHTMLCGESEAIMDAQDGYRLRQGRKRKFVKAPGRRNLRESRQSSCHPSNKRRRLDGG